MDKQVKLLYGVIGLLSLILLCVVFGGGMGKRSEAAGVTKYLVGGMGEPGRYRVAIGAGTNPDVVMVDTETGKCWWAATPGGDWQVWKGPK